jgi:hypothetical protein
LSDESAHERRGSDANAPEAAATRRKFRRVVRTLFLSLKKTARQKQSPGKNNSQGKNKPHATKRAWGTLRATLHREIQNVSAS